MIGRRQLQSLAEVVLCSGFPTQVALSGIAVAAGLQPPSDSGTLSFPFVAFVSAADTAVLAALILWLLRLRQESPRAVLLGPRPVSREVALGVALTAPTVLFMGFAMWWLRETFPGLHTVPDNPLEAFARSPAGALGLLLVALLAGGVREELQRGFLLHRFRTDLGGAATGLMITSAAFGLGHVVQGWDAVLVTAALGAFWGALYFTRGSVLVAMVSHALANGTQVWFAYMQRHAAGT